VGTAKVVGVSQRRTRAGALFQCAALLRWAPGDLLELLAVPDDRRRQAASHLAGAAVGIDVEGRALEDAFLARLADA
jgi:lipoate-protein ligase A